MANKTILFTLNIETSDYVKKVRDAEINVANLKTQQEELYSQLGAIGDQFGYNSEQYESATNELLAYDAAIKVATKDVTNANKQLEDQVRFTNAAEGSYEALYRQWKNAEIALKTQAGNLREAADGTFELTEQGKKAAAEVLRLKEGVLTFNASVKDGRLNVGNYSQAIGDYFSKVEQATRGTGAFGDAIGGIGDVITNTSTGFKLLKQGVEGIQTGLSKASESVGNFFSATSGDTFSTFNEGAEDAVTNVTGLGKAGEDAGKKISIGTNIGANGFKTLRTALISTGIGAFIVVIGSLVAYFLQLQSVTDKIKGAFAGLTAVFKTYLQTVVDIAKAIASLDFGAALDAFTGFFGKASEAAKTANGIVEAEIALEKARTNSIATLDELNDSAERNRLIADDKTKTDEERIKAIEDANEAEKQALELQYELERQALAIAEAKIAEANKTREATRDELAAYEELKKKVGDVYDQIQNKGIQTAAETSKLRNQLTKDGIQADADLLGNQLKRAELSGRETFALQRRLAAQERDAQLSDTTLSEKQKEVIRDNFNTRLAEIDKSAGDARKARQTELQNALIQNILDGQSREIAAVGLATQQRLDAVVKGTQEEVALRKAITEQGAIEILAITQKYAQQTQDERNAVLANNQTIQQNEINSEAQKQQDLLQLQLSYINAKQTKTEEDLAFQQSAAQRSLQIEEQRLQQQLSLQLQATGERIAADQAYYNQLEQQALNSGLSQEQIAIRLAEINTQRQAAELKTEQETGAQITAITDAINANRVQQTVTANNTIAENNTKLIEQQTALNDAVTSAVTTGLGAINEVIGLSEKNQKKFAILTKSLALAELAINLQREISGYWVGVAKDTATGGFILGTVSSAKATAQTIAASIRAAAAIAKISAQKFETGGFTVGDAVKKYNPTVTNSFNGGYVSSPTLWPGMGRMNLAGEAGTEYVAPAWQLKQAPSVFGALENWRRTGVRPFADGGFTTSTITQPLQQNAELIESAILRGFIAAPAPVVSVQEINDTQQRVATIESRATL
jgi:hypothetical protein